MRKCHYIPCGFHLIKDVFDTQGVFYCLSYENWELVDTLRTKVIQMSKGRCLGWVLMPCTFIFY